MRCRDHRCDMIATPIPGGGADYRCPEPSCTKGATLLGQWNGQMAYPPTQRTGLSALVVVVPSEASNDDALETAWQASIQSSVRAARARLLAGAPAAMTHGQLVQAGFAKAVHEPRQCRNPDCDTIFDPRAPNQLYCGDACTPHRRPGVRAAKRAAERGDAA